MSDVPAAVGFDRLPWLADEPPTRAARPSRRRELRRREWLGWAVAAILMVAGASYWLGVRSITESALETDVQPPRPPLTVPLPSPVEAPPAQPEVAIDRPPQIAPVTVPLVRVESAPKQRIAPARATRPKASKATPKARRKTAAPALWPVRVEAGASGRMVRIGTFANRQQAKRGWSRIMRFYPGIKRLPALVVPLRSMRDQRTYYRLQMGTTSQAHSEVLCQRMRIIAQSCVVVDLPAGAGR